MKKILRESGVPTEPKEILRAAFGDCTSEMPQIEIVRSLRGFSEQIKEGTLGLDEIQEQARRLSQETKATIDRAAAVR